jgi:hypothetical protein
MIKPGRDFSLPTAVECLASAPSLRGMRIRQQEKDRLHLMFGEWCLIVALEEYPWVEEENREMAVSYSDHPQASELAHCRRRLAIWSEDPDPDMEHFNDWLLAVECLQNRFTGLLVFDPVNGEWW